MFFVFKTIEGNQYMRKVVVRNVFTYRLRGRFTWYSIVKLISTMYVCFLSLAPFYFGVSRYENCCEISHLLKWFWNSSSWNSPLYRFEKKRILLLSWFSNKSLKIQEAIKEIQFPFQEIKPCIANVIINKH